MENILTKFGSQVLVFSLSLLVTITAYSQDKRVVSGTIVDDTGEALPGVNILIKGTTDGTISDMTGNYSLQVPEDGGVLLFSFIGYLTKEVELNNQEVIDVTLQTDVEQLEEVVVIGYGTIKKSDVTGAMTSLGEESFNRGIMSNPLEMIQGRASGVQITPSSGEPGAAISIKIRGTGSVRSGNGPLYVVDGVPLGGGDVSPAGTGAHDLGGSQAKNPLNFLNPADIESIDILKDASATAIYGSRGANGVVLITTKRGQSGDATINYTSNVSISQIREKMDLLSANDWRDARIQLAVATGETSYATEHDFEANTDWQDEIFRTAISQNHGISISGGSEKGNYRASIGFMDQQGIVESSAMQRLSARINLNQKLLNDKLDFGLNLTSSNVRDENAPVGNGGGIGGDVIKNALTANPTWPIRNPDGSYFQLSETDRNPVAMIDLYDDKTETDRTLGNISLKLNIAKGLNFNTNLGVDKSRATRTINFSDELIYVNNAYGEIRYNESLNYLMENFATYDFNMGTSNFNVMAGYSYQYFETSWHSMVGEGYPTQEILPTSNIGGTTGEIQDQIYSGGRITELQSFYARLNYDYSNKYLLTASFRRDGSSRFGPKRRYGNFPSLALAWRLSEEGFLKGSSIVNNLKLRLGYGQTGNQEFDDYLFVQIYHQAGLGGVQLVQVYNPYIQWESTTQYNVGLDFGLWKDRVYGTLDYFYKSTEDLLFQDLTPDPAITPRAWGNLPGQLVNKGLEASVTVNWLNNTDWSWSSTVNFTMIDNVIEDFKSQGIYTGALNGPGLTANNVQQIVNGQPSQVFYLRQFEGFDSEGSSVFANEQELAYSGSPYSDFEFSINNTLKYKNFDLSIFIDSKQGGQIYNNTANAYFSKISLGQAKNVTYDAIYDGSSLTDTPVASTRFLEDASFIRLSNVTIGWNIPAKAKWMNNPRLYLTGQNLLLLTNYSGFDPEVNTDKTVDGIPSAGIDYTSYPRPRIVQLGFNVNF